MDDTVHEGRIEIELTANEPVRHHRRATGRSARPLEFAARSLPSTPSPQHDAEQATPQSGRPSPNGIAVGAGVAGLLVGSLVGWIAGRADGAPEQVAAAPTTAADARTAPPSSFGNDPSLVELDEPVLTTAADEPGVATTASPDVTSHLLGLDERLVGLLYEIVTVDAAGEVRYVDLAAGRVTIVHGPAGADVGMLFAGDSWTLVPAAPMGDLALYHDADRASLRIANVEPWGLLGVPGAPTLWMPDDHVRMNRPGQMIEVTPDLEPTGVAVAVPAAPLVVEAPGNFVVPAAGGVYVVSGDGISRLTTGRPVAFGPTAALAEECDEELTCEYVVIDRVTGARRELPGIVRGAPLEPVGWWPQSSHTISPDGRLAMVLLPTSTRDPDGSGDLDASRLAVVELVTGQTTPLTEVNGYIHSVVRWTADSQYAFFMADGTVSAYVAETGEVLRTGPDDDSPIRVLGFDVRPSVGTPLLRRGPAGAGTVTVPTPAP